MRGPKAYYRDLCTNTMLAGMDPSRKLSIVDRWARAVLRRAYGPCEAVMRDGNGEDEEHET